VHDDLVDTISLEGAEEGWVAWMSKVQSKENHEKSRAKNEKIQKLWEEVDASS